MRVSLSGVLAATGPGGFLVESLGLLLEIILDGLSLKPYRTSNASSPNTVLPQKPPKGRAGQSEKASRLIVGDPEGLKVDLLH